MINKGILESQDQQHFTRIPTINIVSYTFDRVNFTVKNESDGESARIYYQVGDSTPTTYSSVLDSGETSSTLTFTGLDELTSYTIYARERFNGMYSSSDISGFTTTSNPDTIDPTIQNVTVVWNDLFGYWEISWEVKNNDPSTAEIFTNYNTTPPTSSEGSVASGEVSYTSVGNSFNDKTIYAQAEVSGKNPSNIVSYTL